MDVQAVYEKLRPHVGQSSQRDIGQLRSVDMQRFAVAVGDDLPITMNAAVAAAAGLPDVAAPPLFLSTVMSWDAGPPESRLLADGLAPDGLYDLPVGGLRLMGGGQSLEFLQPVVAGSRIAVQICVKDVQLKAGRSGPLILIQIERTFIGDGEILLRCVETFIGR